jgi:Zn-finger nucleic acid-binding protein
VVYRRNDRCPRCRGPLAREERATIVVHTCVDGDGWFVETTDPNELAWLREMDSEATATAMADDSPALTCPSCEARMRRIFVVPGGVYIDICDAHGTWLDRGELARLAKEPPRTDEPASNRARQLWRMLEGLFGPRD